LSPWNTLPKTNAVLMFDRLMRSMVESTLPQRNLSPSERLTLPLPRSEQHLVVSLARPGAVVEEPLDVTYVSADRRGVVLHGLLTRGVYRVSGKRPGGASNVANDPPVWAAPLAVNGSAEESNLAPLTHDEFNKLTEAGGSHWVGAGEAIDLSGAIIRGQNTWWWLVLCVVGLLVLEFLILSGSVFHAVPAAWFARRSPASPPR